MSFCRPSTNTIRPAVHAVFEENVTLRLGPWKAHRCFLEDTTYVVVVKEMVSINYRNVMKIVEGVFDKMSTLIYEAFLKELECLYSLDINLWWMNS